MATQPSVLDSDNPTNEFEEMLYARHVEIQSTKDLETQRGTPIPALFNTFYKFVQNPSTVSVDTYKRMIDTDDTVGSGVQFLANCLSARLGAYAHPSEEVTAFVNLVLEEIDGGWVNVLHEILSASWAGFSVSEKIWANTERGFVPKQLVTLPPSTILFETERTGKLTSDGILQYQRNYNPMMLGRGPSFFASGQGNGFSGTYRPDPLAKIGDLPFPLRTANSFNYLSVRIPTQKCLHFAYNSQGNFGNPYGRSLLRRAYKYYIIKDAVLQMMTIALDRKGTPLHIVYADPNTTLQDVNQTTPGVNPQGQKGKGISAQEAARKAFKDIHNDTVIFLPGKKGEIYEIDKIEGSSNASDFIAALDFCNKSILRALLIPSLIFGNGDGTGSYSLGQEHAKTFDKILDGSLAGLAQSLIHQLVKDIIMYNFPDSAWKKDGVGKFGKRQLTMDEISKETDIFEKGVNIGAIDMSELDDLNIIRDKMNLPPRKTPIRTREELDAERDQRLNDDQGGGFGNDDAKT